MAGHGNRRIQQGLIGHNATRLQPAGRRQDHLGPGIVDPGFQLVGGKSAEYHRMNRAQPRAGQHADHRFRHHRHIEQHPVALRHPHLGQRARQPGHRLGQFGIGEALARAGHGAVIDQRILPAPPGSDMTVQRVIGQVGFGAWEPAIEGRTAGIQHPVPRAEPVDRLRRLAPEGLGIVCRAGISGGIGACLGSHGRCPSPSNPIFVHGYGG